jgi:hypothetical protein
MAPKMKKGEQILAGLSMQDWYRYAARRMKGELSPEMEALIQGSPFMELVIKGMEDEWEEVQQAAALGIQHPLEMEKQAYPEPLQQMAFSEKKRLFLSRFIEIAAILLFLFASAGVLRGLGPADSPDSVCENVLMGSSRAGSGVISTEFLIRCHIQEGMKERSYFYLSYSQPVGAG